jgi:hypothetical protein
MRIAFALLVMFTAGCPEPNTCGPGPGCPEVLDELEGEETVALSVVAPDDAGADELFRQLNAALDAAGGYWTLGDIVGRVHDYRVDLTSAQVLCEFPGIEPPQSPAGGCSLSLHQLESH